MKRTPTLLVAALGLAMALPFVASAQQTPSAPTTTTVTPAPTTTLPVRHHHHHHGGIMAALKQLNLSDAQRTQIKTDVAQFKQQHPKGSAPDPQARKALHQQILSVLTPDQQAQLKTTLQQQRAAHRARRAGTSQPGTNGVFPPDPAPTASPF